MSSEVITDVIGNLAYQDRLADTVRLASREGKPAGFLAYLTEDFRTYDFTEPGFLPVEDEPLERELGVGHFLPRLGLQIMIKTQLRSDGGIATRTDFDELTSERMENRYVSDSIDGEIYVNPLIATGTIDENNIRLLLMQQRGDQLNTLTGDSSIVKYIEGLDLSGEQLVRTPAEARRLIEESEGHTIRYAECSALFCLIDFEDLIEYDKHLFELAVGVERSFNFPIPEYIGPSEIELMGDPWEDGPTEDELKEMGLI